MSSVITQGRPSSDCHTLFIYVHPALFQATFSGLSALCASAKSTREARGVSINCDICSILVCCAAYFAAASTRALPVKTESVV